MNTLEIFFLARILLLAALNEDEVGERLRHQGVKGQQAPAAYARKSEQADAQPFKRGTLYTLKGSMVQAVAASLSAGLLRRGRADGELSTPSTPSSERRRRCLRRVVYGSGNSARRR